MSDMLQLVVTCLRFNVLQTHAAVGVAQSGRVASGNLIQP